MTLCFELTMPTNNAWNGKWSGDEEYHAKTRNFGRSKKAKEQVQEILSKTPYFYEWDDGWSARISARLIDSKESKTVKLRSKGFAGYEWMIESIINHGKIKVET